MCIFLMKFCVCLRKLIFKSKYFCNFCNNDVLIFVVARFVLFRVGVRGEFIFCVVFLYFVLLCYVVNCWVW